MAGALPLRIAVTELGRVDRDPTMIGKPVLARERECGGVHDLQVARDRLVVA